MKFYKVLNHPVINIINIDSFSKSDGIEKIVSDWAAKNDHLLNPEDDYHDLGKKGQYKQCTARELKIRYPYSTIKTTHLTIKYIGGEIDQIVRELVISLLEAGEYISVKGAMWAFNLDMTSGKALSKSRLLFKQGKDHTINHSHKSKTYCFSFYDITREIQIGMRFIIRWGSTELTDILKKSRQEFDDLNDFIAGRSK